MYCSSCGVEAISSADFCPQCGGQLTERSLSDTGSVSTRESVGPAGPGRPVAHTQGPQLPAYSRGLIAHIQSLRSVSTGEPVGPADPGHPIEYHQGSRIVSTHKSIGSADSGRPIAYLQGAQSDSLRESVRPAHPGFPIALAQGPRSAPTGQSLGPAVKRRRERVYHAQGPWGVSTDELVDSAEPGRPILYQQGPRSVPMRESVRSADSGAPGGPIAHFQGPLRVSTREWVAPTGLRPPKEYHHGPRTVSTDALEESADPGSSKPYAQGPISVHTFAAHAYTRYGVSEPPILLKQGPRSMQSGGSADSGNPRRPIAHTQGPLRVSPADPMRHAQGPRSVSTDALEEYEDTGPPIQYEQRPRSVPTRESGGFADSGAPRGPILHFQSAQSVSTRESVEPTDYGDSRRPMILYQPVPLGLGIERMNPFPTIRKPVYVIDKTEGDIRHSRTHESLRAPPDEPTMGEEVGGLDTKSNTATLSCLLRRFHDITCDPNTVQSTTNNLSTLRFVAGMFDRNGGHLTLEHLGIDLYVPPDAVSDANTEIFMFAQDADERSREEVTETWMPPVIQCGPHGLMFNRHVILTVKHPAKDLSKWSFKFQASNTDIGEAPEWKDLTQDSSAMCFTHEDKTVIFVDHFTLFGLVGKLVGAEGGEKVKKRRFRMGVFAEPLFRDTEIFQLRVRVWQDNKKEERAVRKKEQHLQGVQLGVDKVLHLAGDGGNVSVVLEWLYPGWQVMENDRQTVPFSSLWNDHAEMPSCTFGLERQPSEHTPPRLACRVTALQAAHPGNSVSIDVLKQLGSRQAPDGPSVAPLDPESTFLQLQPELRPTPRCVPQFPSEEQFRRLCLELDLENTAGKDWRSVAEVLHLPYDFIQWTRQRSDPTRRLLDFLVALHGEDSLRVLRDALAEIGHGRALQMVEAMMETADNGPAARAGVQYGATGHQSTDGQPFAGMWHGNDMHFRSHCTTPKEAHSLCFYAPKTVRSGMCNVTGKGSRPSDLQQTLSSGPTSSESTTVEKVSGERSLGEGQEADASMPSTWNVASGNISHVSSV